MSLGMKVQRKNLSDQVEEGILDYIAFQGLKSGDVLPSTTKLATEFGVSRPIIREALKSLEAKGLISIANGKLPTVRPITSEVLSDFFGRVMRQREETLVELLEVRKGIEVQGAVLAAQRRSAEEMANMREIVATMREQMPDPERYLELDVSLHLAIVAASQNIMLYHLVESLREALKDTMREGLAIHATPEQHEYIQQSHEVLVQFIEEGDAEGAGQCMARHFDEAVAAILRKKLGQRAADLS